MSAQIAPEPPASPNPYGAPQQPMSKKELKVQKRMQKAARPWVARHKFLTGVLGIVGIGAVVGIATSGEEDASADAPSSSAPAEAPESSAPAETEAPAEEQPADDGPAAEQAVVEEAVVEEAPAEEPAAPQIGEPVEVGDFEITVTGVEAGIPSVGDQYFGEEAQGQFVVVDVTVTNTGDRPEFFWEDDAALVDTESRQHSTSSSSYLLDESTWLVTEINPGNTANGSLLFDIPADAEVDLLQVTAGMFSTDVQDIRLR